MNGFTRRVGAASARRPWSTVAAWAVVAAVVILLAGTVGGAFVDDFVAPGSQSERAMELLDERFPEAAGGSAMVVFAAAGGGTLDRRREVVEAALARAAKVEHVVSVADPFEAGTVSPDGRVGFADLTFDLPASDLGPAPFEALDGAVAPARAAGVTAELGGEAVFINADAQTSGTEAVGLLAALVVLVVAFGTAVAALVPIGLAVVAVAVGLGGITLLAGAMDVSTGAPTVAAMVGLGVGIDYALFVVARYRENRSRGQDNAAALAGAMGSSGAAVVFAGGTVVVAMAALALTGLGVLTSIGLATSLVVLIAVAAATTLLPALLSLLGDRIDTGRLLRRRRPAVRAEGSVWWRFAHRVSGRPWPYLLVGGVVLLALAAPALRMQLVFPDAGDEPTSTTHRRAYDLLAGGFGPGINGPLLIVADLRTPGLGGGTLPALTERLAADPGIAFVGEPQTAPTGDAAVLPAIPATGPADPATSRTIERVRGLLPAGVYVSGLTAMVDDLTAQLDDTLPVFVAAILAASFLLLMLVFRSIVVPLKAALMNLLSVGAAYGVLVAVFQWGWLGGVVGLEGPVPIASPIPVVMFGILFGLSMDYEVFLLSRIREEHAGTGDDAESVARGLATTGRVITSAALIMVAVFLSFVANPSPTTKMFGLGLATAVALDATVVRMLVVPASMVLMGRANWWLPRWLDRFIPRLTIESTGRRHGAPTLDELAEPVPVSSVGSAGA
ncbi:MAG TPA: MMPL family transporter [Actinomycetes bacterium]|nr:MMPL family transporter [Actinomycetes bacterium]